MQIEPFPWVKMVPFAPRYIVDTFLIHAKGQIEPRYADETVLISCVTYFKSKNVTLFKLEPFYLEGCKIIREKLF